MIQTRTLHAGLLLAAFLLGGMDATGQGTEYASPVGLSTFRGTSWREVVRRPNTTPLSAGDSRTSGDTHVRDWLFAPAGTEGLAAALTEPPAVARETFEGASEALHPVHGVPGGIVLGLEARGREALESELVGARLERGANGTLEVVLASGRRLRCPSIAPDVLDACLAFTAQGSDSLVDMTHGSGTRARVAPAFAGGALGGMLVSMDGIPHWVRPESRAYKSLIVDRAVSLDVGGAGADELVLGAELEVRLYSNDPSGWVRRMGTLDMGAPSAGAFDAKPSLAAELAPLSELAAWLGFLRRMERVDPAGIATLRSSTVR